MSEFSDFMNAIIEEPTGNFVAIAEAAKLNTSTAYVGSDLSGCDFSGCKLEYFNFSRCNMRGITWDDETDFTGAKTMGATFDDGVRGTLKGVPVERLYRVAPASVDCPDPVKAPTAAEALAFFRRADKTIPMARLMMQADSGVWEWVLK